MNLLQLSTVPFRVVTEGLLLTTDVVQLLDPQRNVDAALRTHRVLLGHDEIFEDDATSEAWANAVRHAVVEGTQAFEPHSVVGHAYLAMTVLTAGASGRIQFAIANGVKDLIPNWETAWRLTDRNTTVVHTGKPEDPESPNHRKKPRDRHAEASAVIAQAGAAFFGFTPNEETA